MADPAGGLGEQRNALGDLRRELDRPLSRHRAQLYGNGCGEPGLSRGWRAMGRTWLRLDADVRERRDSVEVDQRRGATETEIQERDQTLPARENLRFAAVTGQQRQCFVHARWRKIVELGWLHGFFAS